MFNWINYKNHMIIILLRGVPYVPLTLSLSNLLTPFEKELPNRFCNKSATFWKMKGFNAEL